VDDEGRITRLDAYWDPTQLFSQLGSG
jgi:hypothetical protein